MDKDVVHSPPHYTTGKIEVIEFIEDQGFGPGFWRGNAIKYATRAGKKDPTKEIEDLEKAVWYLRREIEMKKALKDSREPLRPKEMKEETLVHVGYWMTVEVENSPNVFAWQPADQEYFAEVGVMDNYAMFMRVVPA